MASLNFFLNYAPYLAKVSKSAFVLYIFYDKLQDDKGEIQITYNDIREHTGLQGTTLSKAHKILLDLGLLKALDDKQYFKGKKYEVVRDPIMEEGKRQELFAENELDLNSSFRVKYEKVPEVYKQLLDFEKMKEALRVLGTIDVAKMLAKHFSLDFQTMQLYLETKEFREQVNEVRLKVKAAKAEEPIVIKPEIIKPKPEPKVEIKAEETKEVTPKKTKNLYEQFIAEGNWKRGTKTPLPESEWKAQQVLWYFCILYKRRYGVDYKFTGNLYSSKEMRDMKNVLETLSGGVETKSYLEWVFNVKSKDLKEIDSTGIVVHARMINEFQKIKVKATMVASGDLPKDFKDWIEQNVPEFLEVSNCKTIEDIRWAKKAVDINEATEPVKQVVQEALRRNLLSGETVSAI